MATSGENVRPYEVYTYCTLPLNESENDLACSWEGLALIEADSDNSAVFTCGNGHVNETTWDGLNA